MSRQFCTEFKLHDFPSIPNFPLPIDMSNFLDVLPTSTILSSTCGDHTSGCGPTDYKSFRQRPIGRHLYTMHVQLVSYLWPCGKPSIVHFVGIQPMKETVQAVFFNRHKNLKRLPIAVKLFKRHVTN